MSPKQWVAPPFVCIYSTIGISGLHGWDGIDMEICPWIFMRSRVQFKASLNEMNLRKNWQLHNKTYSYPGFQGLISTETRNFEKAASTWLRYPDTLQSINIFHFGHTGTVLGYNTRREKLQPLDIRVYQDIVPNSRILARIIPHRAAYEMIDPSTHNEFGSVSGFD